MNTRSITIDVAAAKELAMTFERWTVSDLRVKLLTTSDCYLIGMRLDEGGKLEQDELKSILMTIHRGDEDTARLAGELIYKAYYPFVNRYLHRHHPRIAKIPEDDLVQLLSEPFVLVYQKIRCGKYYARDNIKFTTYLIAFAKNLAVNYFSEKKRLRENGERAALMNPVSLDSPVGDEEDGTTLREMLSDPAKSPEDILMDDYILTLLRKAVDEVPGRKCNLTPDQRDVVRLRAEGYSMEEICVALGKSPKNGGNAAKNIYLRAKENVKKIFLTELKTLGFSEKQIIDVGFTLDEMAGGTA
jgi:RNA polymerase sigma factor (sigma-70 family)